MNLNKNQHIKPYPPHFFAPQKSKRRRKRFFLLRLFADNTIISVSFPIIRDNYNFKIVTVLCSREATA